MALDRIAGLWARTALVWFVLTRFPYDRVGLTQFFAHRDAQKLMLANLEWYREHGIQLHVGSRAESIDRTRRALLDRVTK